MIAEAVVDHVAATFEVVSDREVVGIIVVVIIAADFIDDTAGAFPSLPSVVGERMDVAGDIARGAEMHAMMHIVDTHHVECAVGSVDHNTYAVGGVETLDVYAEHFGALGFLADVERLFAREHHGVAEHRVATRRYLHCIYVAAADESATFEIGGRGAGHISFGT